MASLCAAHPTQTHLIRCFNPITKAEVIVVSSSIKLRTGVSQSCFNSRFKNAVTLHVRERLLVAFASNSSPSGEDNIKDKSDEIKSDTSQGPPFLTILAGLLVFSTICWFFSSIVMWLSGFVINIVRPK